MSSANATSSPDKRKRLHLWSARRLSGLRRSKSSPAVRVDSIAAMEESSKSVETAWREDEGRDEEEDALEENGNGTREVVWNDDAASTHTAFKEDLQSSKFEDEGEWAPNLFYAYARRTDDPRFSRFLLTFSNARICAEWWSLIQAYFGGYPSNTREGAQFFSFTGDDIPGRAWKHNAFTHLRTKWMYSQLGDAVGAMGKGQEIIPLQDERGFPIVQPSCTNTMRSGREASPEMERAESRGSFTESLTTKEKEKMAKQLKRSSMKRDSAILLPSSPLINSIGSAYHERSHSLPVLPPDAGGGAPIVTATAPERLFDFERMEQNLVRIERLMDSNASQLRSLEHVQAANLERLTAALVSNADMIRELGSGQQRLGEACEELRKAVRERDERSERMSLRSVGSVGSANSVGSAGQCSHDVKRGPRKIGRTVVGYVYADGANGEGVKTVVPAAEVGRKK